MIQADLTSDLERQVRERIRAQGFDPFVDGPETVGRLVDEVLAESDASIDPARDRATEDRSALRRKVIDHVAGLGPLQPLMDDPTVEEIWINGPGKVFCAQAGEKSLTNVQLDDPTVRELVERMLRLSGRRLDLSTPFVDAMLGDGSRLHVAIPTITRRHWAVNIRKFVVRATGMDELVRLRSLDERTARFLSACVVAGLNILVSGGTQTGKTTMLNCLAAAVPPRERVITCEEVFELKLGLPDVVSLQTRAANIEGSGEIALRRLVVEALRMRPDRLIVGEVRQGEALDLLIALNSGLPGMTSIHANSAREALLKLSTLPLMAGENVTHGFVVPTVARTMDLVIHLGREGARRVTQQVVAVPGRVEDGAIEAVTLFDRGDTGLVSTGHPIPFPERFRSVGLDPLDLLR